MELDKICRGHTLRIGIGIASLVALLLVSGAGTEILTDISPPVINSVTLSNSTPSTGDDILVTVDATDDVAVTGVTIDGTPITQNGSVWTGTITAVEGTHTVTVTANDAAGNATTDISQSYTATDKKRPVINSVILSTSTPNTGDPIQVTVDATDNVGVTSVKANDVALALSGSVWTGTINAIEGAHTVTVMASDAAGNVAWNNATSYTTTIMDGTISGTVTDAASLAPISGATVIAETQSVTTDGSGSYSLPIAPGIYTVTASATGYNPGSASVTVTSGATSTQNFALIAVNGTISGIVTDVSTGLAISGATVTAGTQSATTNAEGFYSITIAPGTYIVTATATDYNPRSESVTVTSGAISTQNFALTATMITLGEAVDNTGLTWLTGGGANWFGQTKTVYYGGDAAQSGDISDTQSTLLSTAVTGPGNFVFFWKVSSEVNDLLEFDIDGVRKAVISGEGGGWQEGRYSIGSGTHMLQWKYSKDGQDSGGSDAGWIDKVRFSKSLSTVLPLRISKTAPYANPQLSTTPNWGGIDREFIQAGHNDRIRQNGTIYQIRFAVADVSNLEQFNFTVWRQNGSNYDRIATTDNLIDYISDGNNTINLSHPIEGVQEGDFYGYRIKATANSLYVDPSITNHKTYYADGTASSTNYDWTNQNMATNVFVIEPYMGSPYVVFTGDSIISGYPEHQSFIEETDITNIPTSIENHWARKVNKIYQNMGYGEQSTDSLNNRFNSDVVDLSPEFVLIEGGVNDINNDTGALKTNTLVNWKYMIQKAYSNNITPVIMLILPCTSCSSAKTDQINYINEEIIKLADDYSPSILVDARCYIGAKKPTGPAGNCWDINPSYTSDGLHFNSAGNERIAQAIKDSFKFVHGKPGLYNLIQPDGTIIYSTNLKNAINTSWRMASTSSTANVSYNTPLSGELANLTINSGTIDWFNIGNISSHPVYYLRNSNGAVIESGAAVNGNVNFTSDMLPGTYYVQAPIVITITSPANNSINKTGYINVNVTLDRQGSALLNWDGINESMSGGGTSFYRNKTGLLSGNYSFRGYADSNGIFSVSETRTATINREIVDTTIGNFINASTFVVNTTLGIEAPSGNVTLTIFNGTIATSNGTALNRITIDSVKQVNPAYVLTGNDKFIGENLTLGPAGAHFSPDIQLQFNYTAGQLAAAGISESELSVKYFNTSDNKWEALTITGRGSGDPGYIIVNVSHFSTFALIGTPSAPNNNNPGSGGSGGGGGGGGGGVSGESFENILLKEVHDLYIFNGLVTSYRFTDRRNPIMFVNITGNANAGEIAGVVEVLRNTSSFLNTQAPGEVYSNINIWLGTSGFAVPKNIKEAVIMFRVNNSWIRDNDLKRSDIKMVVWSRNENIWNQLETAEKANDNTYTYYEAKTGSFSHFAITGLKKSALPQIMTGTSQAITNNSTNISAADKVLREIIPQFEWTIILLVLILISIIIVLRSK